jgi:formylglycine-generating enzyme required for sulfatase activity
MSITIVSAELGFGLGDDQFVLIQPGSFQMGSGIGDADERPVHEVALAAAYYLQKTEVTQLQWKTIVGSNPSFFANCGDTCPVERVSWNDVQQFLAALNAANPGANYRLPTEAEWEYAARAGTTGDYGGTGQADDMGWYSGNSGSKTQFVGLKQPNAWGLYDMHGNAWEWVQDWYSAGYYGVSPGTDPPGPVGGTARVLRGGGVDQVVASARSTNRSSASPSSSGFAIYYGFRLARTP